MIYAIPARRFLALLLVGPFAAHTHAQVSLGPRTDYDTGGFCYDPVAVDLDGDGRLDLVAPRHGNGPVSVLFNVGGGSFAAPMTVPTSLVSAQGAVVGDFDGDGDSDLAVTGNTDQMIAILHNVGGILSEVQAVFVGIDDPVSPASITAADFDGDGDLDLASANRGTHIGNGQVSVLLNDGSGLFQLDQTLLFLGLPTYLRAADMDGDGDVDLVTTSGSAIAVVLNLGGGSFSAPWRFTTAAGTGFQQLVVRDLDGDQDLDVVGTETFTDAVFVWANLGSGGGAWTGLGTPVSYTLGPDPNGVAAADLDKDGDLDLAVSSSASLDVTVLLNDGFGSFDADGVFPVAGLARRLTAADLDGDGVEDLIGGYADPSNQSLGIYTFLGRVAIELEDVSIHPKSLKTTSSGNWVTCYITPPPTDPVTSLSPDSAVVAEVNGVPVAPLPVVFWALEDQDEDGSVETLMVKFDRTTLAALLQPGQNVITVRGAFVDGRSFEGSDTIRAKQ